MYCKKCGKELHDGDRFCSNCGTPVASAESVVNNSPDGEDTVVNKPKIDTSEFVWDVHEFNKPARKVENLKVDWEKGTVTEIGDEPEAPEETVWSVPEEETQPEEVQTEARNEFAGIEMPEIGETFSWTSGIKLDDIEKAIAAERAQRSEYELEIEEQNEEPEAEEDEEVAAETAEETAEVRLDPQEGDIPVTLEDIQLDVEASQINKSRERDTARLNKFFTLNKKNEEFQKLLDMEYERIKSGQEGSYIMPEVASGLSQITEAELPGEEHIEQAETTAPEVQSEPQIDLSGEPELRESDDTLLEAPVPEKDLSGEPELREADDTLLESPVSEPFDPVAHLKKAEEERNAALGIGAAGLAGAALAGMSDSHRSGQKYYDENGEEMRIFDTMELQKDILEASMPSTPAKPKTEIVEEISDKIATTKEGVEKTYSSLLDDIFGQISQEHIAESGKQQTIEPETSVYEAEAPADEPEAAIAESGTTVFAATQTEETPQTDKEDLNLETPVVPSFFDEPEDDDGDERSGCLGKVIIAILAVILIIGVAILSIKSFFPDSTAAAFINEKLAGVTQMFGGGNDNDGDQIDDGSQDGEDAENPDGTGDEDQPQNTDRSEAIEDKTEVIEFVKATENKNIKSITYNADVKFDANHKYNSTDVYKTKPLESNILYEEGGTKHYVDEEVLKTLIAYDSGWIDYVNTRDNAIFATLKPGSDAEKNTKAWNVTGITKQFDSLEIGEIRADDNGYYVWAHEKISTTKSGNTTTDEYNWVYYMELTDGKLLIVDYYK